MRPVSYTHLYYCFCDKERLESLRTSVSENGTEIVNYDKHCLSLSKEEIEANLASGKPYVIRINMPTAVSYTHLEMADKYGDKLKFTSLNTTKARRLAIGQKILGLPVMAIYKDGEKVEEVVKDDATQENIEAMIKKYI